MTTINPIQQIAKSAWTKSSFTDGKQISTAKRGNPMDWTVKALFDSMLAQEKESRRIGAYRRGYKNGV